MAIKNAPAQIAYGYPNPQAALFPSPILAPRPPNTFDRGELGQSWIDTSTNLYYVLVEVAAGVSTWIEVAESGAVGSFSRIELPDTDAAGDGVIYFGGNRFVSEFGTRNSFFGEDSGNLTLAGATDNTGIGWHSLQSLTTGDQNSALGAESLDSVTTGGGNTAVGFQSLANLLTGIDNTAVGFGSGQAYVAAESSNVLLGNAGVIGDANIMRLGTDGNGPGQQITTQIAGDVFAARNLLSTDSVFVQGDNLTGIPSTLGLTNQINQVQGVGALTLLSTNGNSGTNQGFLKVYVGATTCWVPFFDDIAP